VQLPRDRDPHWLMVDESQPLVDSPESIKNTNKVVYELCSYPSRRRSVVHQHGRICLKNVLMMP
jgi:hypothetical protein